MPYLSEAHQQWHQVNGRDKICPLDCGAAEADDDWREDQEAYEAEQAAIVSTLIDHSVFQ